MNVLKALALVLLPLQSFAQSDTTWYDINGKISDKYFANNYRLVTTGNKLLYLKEYYVKNNHPKLFGQFEDSALSIRSGIFVRYRLDGTLSDSVRYDNNERKEGWNFDKVGTIEHWIYQKGQLTDIVSYDENKKEIKIHRDSSETKGFKLWKDFLEVSMDNNQPKAYKKGKIFGNVTIVFIVGEDGYVSDVSIQKSSGYKELDNHALNIIKFSPRWISSSVGGRPGSNYRYQPFHYPSLNVSFDY